MNKTASMVLKIIGASLAFAAVICLLIGGWHDLSVGYSGMKKRLARKFAPSTTTTPTKSSTSNPEHKKDPIQMDGALFCVFSPHGNKKRLEEIPNRNEIPLDRGKKPW